MDSTRRGHGWRARVVLGALLTTGGVALATLLGGSAAVGAPACTLNFTNAAGGSWFTATNWSDAVTPSTHRVPASTDVACVPATVTGPVTFSGTSTVQTLNVKSGGGFQLTAGTLTLSDAANASAIKRLQLSGGTVAGAGAITLSGASTWSSGTMQNTGGTSVASGATLAVTSTGGYAYLYNNASLTNHGTITVTNGNYLGLSFETAATLTNAADGTIDLHGDGANLRSAGGNPSAITNDGTITRSKGTGTTTISVPLTSALDHVHMGAGTGDLSLSGGGSLSGTATIPSGATLSFDNGTAPYTITGATFNGAGSVMLNGVWSLAGSNTVNSAFTVNDNIAGAGGLTIGRAARWNEGMLSNTGGTTVASGASVAITSTGYYASLDASALTNHGTITVTNGNFLGLTFEVGATLTNSSDGTIDLQGDNANLRNGGGNPSAITNDGTIEHTTGTGTTTISVPLSSALDGIVQSPGTGVLSLSGGGSLSGTATIPAGATLSFDNGTTPYTLNGASINGAGTTTLDSDWTLSGTNTIHSPFTMNDGADISGAGSLTLAGSSTWNSAVLQNTGGTTVASGATLAVTSTGYYAYLDATTLTNHGTITVTNGNYSGLTLDAGATLANASDGTIALDGDGANLRTGGGAASTVTNDGAITHATGTASTAGVSVTNGATGLLRVDSGTLRVPTLTNFAANALNGGRYVVAGTLQLDHTPGTIVTNAASITLAGPASAIVDDQAHDLVLPMTTNSGSLTLTGGRTLSTSAVTFTNSGTVSIGDGAHASQLGLAGPYTQTAGSTTVALGSTLIPTGVAIQGGTLGGAGTVIGTVTTSGTGVVQNASNAGPLNLGSGYAGTGRVKAAISSATGYDRIAITGTGDLTGSRLAVSTKAGYAPPQGKTFTIITCSTACTGPFASVTGLTMSDGAFYQIAYGTNSVTLTAIRNADVSVTNVDSADPIAADAPAGPHSSLTYTVTVTNDGPAPANGVVVTDTLPHDAVLTNAPAGCIAAGDTQTCSVGTIAAGADDVLTFLVRPPVPGTLVNTVSTTAVPGSPDPNAANNPNVAQSTLVTPQPHTSYVVVDDGPGGVSFSPTATPLKKLGDTVQFDFFGTASHQIVSKEGAIDTGVHAPGDEVAIAITNAGLYTFHDALGPAPTTGTINAKPVLSGTGSSRTVTWATVAPPAGYVFDVRVKTPTGTIVLFTGTTATGTNYTADQGPGAYKIQVRLRRTSDNKATGYASSKAFSV